MREEAILVYVDLQGESLFVGRLWSHAQKGRERASFEYDSSWLENPRRFSLDPALALKQQQFQTDAGKALFGAIGDSAPDRWGRKLMQRAERLRAKKEGQTQRTLMETDYLLRVDDQARLGALRFKIKPDDGFLSSHETSRIPPLIRLPQLLSSAERVSGNREDADEIEMLVAAGTSLGGARPKASIIIEDGILALAKFPDQPDDFDVVSWEGVALSLAMKAGIAVPQWRIENVRGKPVIIINRFDRHGEHRIPFLSAMSMLEARDKETRSYMEIADVIRRHGSVVGRDLEQLWRRIVFNVLVSNTDDHLRNHGFLYDGQGGWRLSPAYDMNPVPASIKPRILSTSIGLDDPSASLEIAFETAEYYKLSPLRAREIVGEVADAMADWRSVAARIGVNGREIERMSSAFTHEDMKLAIGNRASGKQLQSDVLP